MDADQERSILERLVGFARAVEGFARRTSGAFLGLAVVALAAAVWIAFYLRQMAGWPALLSFPISLIIVAPPLALIRLSVLLRGTIGLPDRIMASAAKLHGGAGDLRRVLDRRDESGERRPRVGQLLDAGRAIWSLRKAGGEVRELVTSVGGAAAIWSPLFPVFFVLAAALSATLVLMGLAVLGIWAF